MATYDITTNTFTLGDGEEVFAIPLTLPTNTTTPANAGVIGNQLNNTITGDATNNRLDGGLGADTLKGGLGDDIYVIDEESDDAVELDDQGYDTVETSVSYVLGANLEKLVLIGNDDISGFGNGLDNVLEGNGATNMLVGGGGNDTVIGGGGTDILVGGTGIDTVSFIKASAGLQVNLATATTSNGDIVADFENIIGSAFADELTGDDADNLIQGAGGVDVLNGAEGNDTLDGGSGNDIMAGDVGDDTYLVDSANDLVNEAVGQGTDTVITSVSYTLGAAEIEALIATEGTSAINLTGNDFANRLVGNDGVNRLAGGGGLDLLDGGLGNDVLAGGAGKDTFRFSTTLNKDTNLDTIEDYVKADDSIQLENAIFKKLKRTGKLSKDFFVMGSKAKDKNDYIIYDNKTGLLSYDADGSGSNKAVAFAKLAPGLLLNNAEFFVV